MAADGENIKLHFSDLRYYDGKIKQYINNKVQDPSTTSDKVNKVTNATDGNFASLDSNGDIKDSGHKHEDYLTSVPAASTETIGGIKIDGTTITIDENGVAKANSQIIQTNTMPTAAAKYNQKIIQYVGATDANYIRGYFYQCIQNVSDSNEVTYAWARMNVQPVSGDLEPASTSTVGGVKVDGTTITIDNDGTIHAPRVDTLQSLNDLSDVDIDSETMNLDDPNSTVLTNGDVLTWDSLKSKWVNKNASNTANITPFTQDLSDTNDPKLIIQNYEICFINKSIASNSTISETFTFNPVSDFDMITDGYIDLTYSCDTVSTLQSGQYTAYAKLYKNGTLLETLYLDDNGLDTGNGSDGSQTGNSTFATQIIHEDANYKIKFYGYSYVRSPNQSSNRITNTVLKIILNAPNCGRVTKDGFVGRFKGLLEGNARLGFLNVGKWVTDTNNTKITYDDEDSDYDGAYYSRGGSKTIDFDYDENNPEDYAYRYIITSNNSGKISLSTKNYSSNTSTTKYVTWEASDERIKNNINTIDTQLSKDLINRTTPKEFEYIDAPGAKHYGMIAQEARQVLDELGETNAQLEYSVGDSEELEDQRNINYNEYIPHLINYVKDLQNQISELQKQLKGE